MKLNSLYSLPPPLFFPYFSDKFFLGFLKFIHLFSSLYNSTQQASIIAPNLLFFSHLLWTFPWAFMVLTSPSLLKMCISTSFTLCWPEQSCRFFYSQPKAWMQIRSWHNCLYPQDFPSWSKLSPESLSASGNLPFSFPFCFEYLCQQLITLLYSVQITVFSDNFPEHSI